jgi:tetratricopeptide (TPR) repeat protein
MRSTRRFVGFSATVQLLVLGLGLAGPFCATAAEPPTVTALKQARKQLEAGNFERTIRSVQSVLDGKEPLTESLRAEGYRLMGLAHLYLGHEAKAREAYEKLLQIQPDYELPPTESPKLQEIFKRIVDDLGQRRLPPVTLSVAKIPDLPGNQSVTLKASIDNMAPYLKAKLHYRKAGRPDFSATDFMREKEGTNVFAALIPAYELKAEDAPYRIEYYAEVADAAKRRLAGKGTADLPESFQVLPLPLATGAPLYKKPLFWVIVGGAAVVVATGTILLVTASKAPATP